MGFSSKYWSGLLFPSQDASQTRGQSSVSCTGKRFTTEPQRSPQPPMRKFSLKIFQDLVTHRARKAGYLWLYFYHKGYKSGPAKWRGASDDLWGGPRHGNFCVLAEHPCDIMYVINQETHLFRVSLWSFIIYTRFVFLAWPSQTQVSWEAHHE